MQNKYYSPAFTRFNSFLVTRKPSPSVTYSVQFVLYEAYFEILSSIQYNAMVFTTNTIVLWTYLFLPVRAGNICLYNAFVFSKSI